MVRTGLSLFAVLLLGAWVTGIAVARAQGASDGAPPCASTGVDLDEQDDELTAFAASLAATEVGYYDPTVGVLTVGRSLFACELGGELCVEVARVQRVLTARRDGDVVIAVVVETGRDSASVWSVRFDGARAWYLRTDISALVAPSYASPDVPLLGPLRPVRSRVQEAVSSPEASAVFQALGRVGGEAFRSELARSSTTEVVLVRRVEREGLVVILRERERGPSLSCVLYAATVADVLLDGTFALGAFGRTHDAHAVVVRIMYEEGGGRRGYSAAVWVLIPSPDRRLAVSGLEIARWTEALADSSGEYEATGFVRSLRPRADGITLAPATWLHSRRDSHSEPAVVRRGPVAGSFDHDVDERELLVPSASGLLTHSSRRPRLRPESDE